MVLAPGAGNFQKLLLAVLPLRRNDLLWAVELDVRTPEAQIVVRRVALQLGRVRPLGHGENLHQLPVGEELLHGLRRRSHGRPLHRAAEVGHAVGDAGMGDMGLHLNEPLQVLEFRHIDHAGAVRLVLRAQLHAHLGDHAEVRLGEDAVNVGAEAVVVFGEHVGARQGTHAGAQQVAGGQHHLHAALIVKAVPPVGGGVGAAVVQGVADDAAPGRVHHLHGQPIALLLNVAEQVEQGHARFNDGVVLLVVDLDDAVHALEVQHHAVLIDRRCAAVA